MSVSLFGIAKVFCTGTKLLTLAPPLSHSVTAFATNESALQAVSVVCVLAYLNLAIFLSSCVVAEDVPYIGELFKLHVGVSSSFV